MKSIKQYMKFVAPYKWKILWTILIGIVKFAIPLLIPLILKYVIDNIITVDTLTQSEKTTRLFWLMGISFVVFLFLRSAFVYFGLYLALWVEEMILLVIDV